MVNKNIMRKYLTVLLLIAGFSSFAQYTDTIFFPNKKIQSIKKYKKPNSKLFQWLVDRKQVRIVSECVLIYHSVEFYPSGKKLSELKFGNRGLTFTRYYENGERKETIKSQKKFLFKYGFEKFKSHIYYDSLGIIKFQRNYNSKGLPVGLHSEYYCNKYAYHRLESKEMSNLPQKISLWLNYWYCEDQNLEGKNYYYDKNGILDSVKTIYAVSTGLANQNCYYDDDGKLIKTIYITKDGIQQVDSLDYEIFYIKDIYNNSYCSGKRYKGSYVFTENHEFNSNKQRNEMDPLAYRDGWNFKIEKKWTDISKNRDSTITINFVRNGADTLVFWLPKDTLYESGSKINGKKVGKWSVLDQHGHLLEFAKYPPYQFAKDTMHIIYDKVYGGMVKIKTIDTAINSSYEVEFHKNDLYLFDSLFYIRDQLFCRKRFYSNGKLCFERYCKKAFLDEYNSDSLSRVYYPSGILLSDDFRYNRSYNHDILKDYVDYLSYPFWLHSPNNPFGEKYNNSIKLIKPISFNLETEGIGFGWTHDKKYSILEFNNYYHLFDNSLRKMIYPYIEEREYRWSVRPTNNALIWDITLRGEYMEERGMFVPSKDYKSTKTELYPGGNRLCFDINSNGNILASVESVNQNSQSGEQVNHIKLSIVDIKNNRVLIVYQLDSINKVNRKMFTEDYEIKFIDDTQVYLNFMEDKNVFSIKGSFVDSIDYSIEIDKLRLKLFEYDTVIKSNRYIFEVVDDNGKHYEIIINSSTDIDIDIDISQNYPIKWYSHEMQLFYSNRDKLFRFDFASNQIDTLVGKEFIKVLKWGEKPADIECIIKNESGYSVLNPILNEREVIFSQSKEYEIESKKNSLLINPKSENIEIPLIGLVGIKDQDSTSIPLDAKWEVSSIHDELDLNPFIYHKEKGKFIYSLKNKSSVFCWNPHKKRRIEQHIQLLVQNDGTYGFIAPDQYYFLAKGASKHFHFQNNYKVYAFEQFDLKFNRPDIILERLGYADSVTIASYHKAYLKRLKKMNFTEDMLKEDFQLPEILINNYEYLTTNTDTADLNLELDLKDSKYKLDRVNILINDVAVYGSAGLDLRRENVKQLRKRIKLKLAEGENKIQVSVLNQAGAESYKETVYITYKPKQTKKPDLYLVTIGDSKYKDTRYDLTYASKDAEDIKSTFEKKSTYANVFTYTYTNEQVTKQNILKLKQELKKAKRDDVVIITVAGHGVLDKDFNYYIATYDMDFNNPAEKGLPYEDLESLVDGIAPLKKVIFLDACHSGEVDKEEVEQLAMNTTSSGDVKFRAAGAGIQKKNLGLKTTSELMGELFTDLRRGTGATVISSAGGAEYAIESNQWKNGLFTYCMLHGLKDKAADANKDGQIMLSELQQYLRTEVTKLSNGAQQPTSRIENLSMDFRIW
jgi:uncharacterized caspase-like protein